LEKIVIHSKGNKEVTLNTESQSRVFLGELSYKEIRQIILEIHFLNTNFNYSFVSYFPCKIINNTTPLLGAEHNCYNIIIQSIDYDAVQMIIEPIEINVDKERQNKQKQIIQQVSEHFIIKKYSKKSNIDEN